MKREYRYIVIGLGGLGSGAAYWLSKRAGSEVLGIEQFELGHVRGASQDHSRIIRLSYHSPVYVRLAQQAFQAWKTLENDSHERLIIPTGGLDLWPENAIIPMSDYTTSLDACDIPYELIDATEIRRRYPHFQITNDVVGLFQEQAGIAAAARCNAAHQRMSRENGAVFETTTGVVSIRTGNGEYVIRTAAAEYSCEKLLVACGAWTNKILSLLDVKPLPLTVTQEQVTYFVPPSLSDFQPGHFPIWIWMDEPSFYGFPVYGEQAVKVAQDCGGNEVTAESRSFEPRAEALQRVINFLQRYLPSALGPVLYSKTCLYTLTPDRDFVIDRIPDHPGCFITIGAGHAFKFASVIGKILSELAIDGKTASDISPFRFDRPVLHMENPPKNFMV